ncbi:MAG: hypothetical protein VKJ44_07025 [Synechococcus sp.]|nr:hypothetical protein [Synechococcus sp.]
MSEPEFVFGHQRPELQKELSEFWTLHQPLYRQDLQRFRSSLGQPSMQAIEQSIQPPLRRQVAAISRDGSGRMTGLAWVVLRELQADLGLGSHAYFLRMYVAAQARNASTHRLFEVFLDGFQASASSRDPRAGVLLAENVNPGLHTVAGRRYFARRGFRLLGGNQFGSEVWLMRLKTRFVF